MIEVNVEQGTPEWHRARLGHPTASNFNRIITPKKMTRSTADEKYMNRLLAEWMIGEPLDDVVGAWLERGTDLEDQARAWYEFEHDIDVRQVGLVKTDDGMVSGSPDGLIGDEGGLEIKCPSASVHMAHMRWGDTIPPEHHHQVQGNLWVAEREWWDFVSWNPVMPKVLIRTYRDEKHIATLSNLVGLFVERLMEARSMLRKRYAIADPVEVDVFSPSEPPDSDRGGLNGDGEREREFDDVAAPRRPR